MVDAARRLAFGDGSFHAVAADAAVSPATSAWTDAAEKLSLVLDASRFESMLAEATRWAERITLCLTAPQSQRGTSPWWGELLARSTKCDRIYVRRPEHTEAWLLHRLHDTGALRWLNAGGKQVAANLLLFSRDGELRVLLSHIGLERAVAGAGFGALLAFRGAESGELARSCRAQVESWATLASIPTGSDVDTLTLERLRAEQLAMARSPSEPFQVISEPEELRAALQRFAAEGGLNVRPVAGGYHVALQSVDAGCAPFVLTLEAGAAWASGNALVLRCRDGEAVLVWRGGLLGHSPSRRNMLWSAARLQSLMLDDALLGAPRPVAVVAHGMAPLVPQFTAFSREVARLGEVFGVEPPPSLGHALADFDSLSSKQQTLLLERALIGLGPLDVQVATLTAAAALRDQGYLRCTELKPHTAPYATIVELLARAAESGAGFDRPEPGKIRAIQPERRVYQQEDWLECLLLGLPENEPMPRSRAARLAFEHARRYWGLSGERLARGHALERTLDHTVSDALRRGLCVRVGAGAIQRVSPVASNLDVRPSARRTGTPETGAARSNGFATDWFEQLESASPAQCSIALRRAGWYGARESLESVAQRLGISLERARQLEAEAWAGIEQASGWVTTARARLERALGGARAVSVRALQKDDAWWRGAELHLGLAEAAFENVFAGELHCIELRSSDVASLHAGEVFFARFAESEVDAVFASLRQRAALVPTPATLGDYEPLLAAAVEQLDPSLEEYLRDELQALLVIDPRDPTRVESFVVERTGGPVEIAVESGVDSERRLRLEDAARSAFRSAGTPLSLAAVTERVNQRIDADEAALRALLCHAPFVQRNADQYGLLVRDVPGGVDAIAAAINTVAAMIEANQRPLAARQAFMIVQARTKQSWSYELVRSLLSSDPALHLSPSEVLTLVGSSRVDLQACKLEYSIVSPK